MDTKWHFCDYYHINCLINPKLCETTHHCNTSISEVRQSYSTRVEDNKIWRASKHEANSKNLPLFGIELELETLPISGFPSTRTQALSQFPYTQSNVIEAAKLSFWKNKFNPFGIIKSDGSLVCGGEFVTTPQSYHKTLEFITLFGMELEQYKEDCPLYATPRCGLHIHVSKPNPIIIKKIMLLWNSFNSETITQIARRAPNTYCKQNPITKTSLKQPNIANTDKYSTINTNKANTIEFRSFASTTNTDQLLSSIEFVHSTLTFCEETNLLNILPSKYIQYLQNNKNTYPYAFAQLAKNKKSLDHLISNPSVFDKNSPILLPPAVKFNPQRDLKLPTLNNSTSNVNPNIISLLKGDA